ncbi:MAG TPA: hypothetical protein VH560_01465 [Polyangia bacterium]|jgi:hypothetical protein|nr:hypothetical protein [Polyangia bacterium]
MIVRVDVIRSKGWYEGKCRELGVVITARDLASLEATVRRITQAAALPDPTLVVAERAPTFLEKIWDLFDRGREGNA